MTRVPMLRVWLPALLWLSIMTLPDRGWAGSVDGAARPVSVPHGHAHTSAATEPAIANGTVIGPLREIVATLSTQVVSPTSLFVAEQVADGTMPQPVLASKAIE